MGPTHLLLLVLVTTTAAASLHAARRTLLTSAAWCGWCVTAALLCCCCSRLLLVLTQKRVSPILSSLCSARTGRNCMLLMLLLPPAHRGKVAPPLCMHKRLMAGCSTIKRLFNHKLKSS